MHVPFESCDNEMGGNKCTITTIKLAPSKISAQNWH